MASQTNRMVLTHRDEIEDTLLAWSYVTRYLDPVR